jgi:hypothetical protein
MVYRVFIIICMVIISGCSHQKLNRLEVGMSPEQVEKILGQPERTSYNPYEKRLLYGYTLTNSDLQKVRVGVFFNERNELYDWKEFDRTNINLAPVQAWADGMSQPNQSYSAPPPVHNNQTCGPKPMSRHGCESYCVNGRWDLVCQEYSGSCGSKPPLRSNCSAMCVNGTWEVGCT